ncbi:ferredoxin [Novosphingobium sp. Fuku2-ISO-50]|uniref:ferredoxin n=1 Tax=Novosphingobium sp. Fuku2-ISO-50 TaxID=1739114 RepID=UPI00076D34A6|nr:ferredoxin [Novosphingobium sp. Fuku2-ISO-50]KUR73263.1 ferredoxin [Novosphingobium sp. Fuku2-ISO-50]
MKVHIDEIKCTGHGRCAKYAPNVFTLNDEDGYNADRGKTIDVPADEEANARLGVKSCPERAITIID